MHENWGKSLFCPMDKKMISSLLWCIIKCLCTFFCQNLHMELQVHGFSCSYLDSLIYSICYPWLGPNCALVALSHMLADECLYEMWFRIRGLVALDLSFNNYKYTKILLTNDFSADFASPTKHLQVPVKSSPSDHHVWGYVTWRKHYYFIPFLDQTFEHHELNFVCNT